MNKPAGTVGPWNGMRQVVGGWVPDSRGTWFIALVVAYAVASTTLDPYLFVPLNQRKFDFSANAFNRVIKLGMLGLGTGVALWRLQLAQLLLRRLNPFLLVFLILVPISAMWSISRGDTIARYISIVSNVMLCTGFCLYGFTIQRLQNVVRPTLNLMIMASIVYAVLFPELGIEQGIGTLHDAWRGITTQKNQFGQLASFATVFWLHAALYKEDKRWKVIVFGVAAFTCVLLSRSSTSLMATVFSVTFMLLLYGVPENIRRYLPYIVGTFAVVLVVYAMAVLKIVPGLDILLSPVVAFTGKDLTFSNRSEIWVIIKEHIERSPWIGTGYGAYWTGETGNSPSLIFLSRMYFYPGESHNGYIEITNDLGFMGLIVLLGYLWCYVRQSLRLMVLNRSQGVLYLCLFFQQAILNLSGSSWLCINNGFAFIIMTLATLTLARTMLEYDLQAYFGSPGAMIERRAKRSPAAKI